MRPTPETATVSVANSAGVATITGRHTYRVSGTFTARVLAADSISDALGEVQVTVGKGPIPPPSPAATTLAAGSSVPGSTVVVRGNGFAPGEKVTIALGSGPVSRAAISAGKAAGTAGSVATADAAGAVTASVVVPEAAGDGLYGVTLRGATSRAVAADTVTVAAPQPARVYHPQALLSSDAGPRGQLVRADANSFAAGEWVMVSFDGVRIGAVQANADGVVTDLRLTVPTDAKAGRHTITFAGGSSAATAALRYTVLSDAEVAGRESAPAGAPATRRGTDLGVRDPERRGPARWIAGPAGRCLLTTAAGTTDLARGYLAINCRSEPYR
jgi:hypothetical protein